MKNIWKTPPKIKVYEALGCVADERIEIMGSEAKVFSSSLGKYYSVWYEQNEKAIMVNDNGSFYIGYLGYPAIAYLMKEGRLPFDQNYSDALKGIHWKDLNMKYNRSKGDVPDYDFDSVLKEIDQIMLEKGIDLSRFHIYVEEVLNEITRSRYRYLGEKITPPQGY